MIVSHKMALAAWHLLISYARVTDEAWDLIQTRPMESLTKDVIASAYRTAARYTHPDTTQHDSAAEFAAVDRAKHVLLAWLERQSPDEATKEHGGVTACPRCKGERTITLQRGFRQMKVQCPTCKGNGEIYDERDKAGDRQS